MFKHNESPADRLIRIVIGIAALAAGAYLLDGTTQIILFAVGIILLITGALGFCGIYALLGIRTNKTEKS